MRLLFVNTRSMVFHADSGWDAATTAVNDLADDTELVDVSSSDDLRLGEDAKTLFGGFRYTQSGMRQVLTACRCGGIYRAICDIVRDDHEDVDAVDATIRLFNEVVSLRAGRLVIGEYRLVVHTREGVIDGVVSARYQPLSHRDFLEILDGVSLASDVAPDWMSITGRRMAVCYLNSTRWDDPDGRAWFAGHLAVNSETAGDAAVSIASIWSRDEDGALLAVTPMGCVRHVGRDLMSRTLRLASRVESSRCGDGLEWAEETAREWADMAVQAAGRRVDLDDPSVFKHEVRRLRSNGLSAGLAIDVVNRAYRVGSSPLDASADERTFSRRSEWDLACALLGVANHRHDRVRERVGLVAGRIIAGPQLHQQQQQQQQQDRGRKWKRLLGL